MIIEAAKFLGKNTNESIKFENESNNDEKYNNYRFKILDDIKKFDYEFPENKSPQNFREEYYNECCKFDSLPIEQWNKFIENKKKDKTQTKVIKCDWCKNIIPENSKIFKLPLKPSKKGRHVPKLVGNFCCVDHILNKINQRYTYYYSYQIEMTYVLYEEDMFTSEYCPVYFKKKNEEELDSRELRNKQKLLEWREEVEIDTCDYVYIIKKINENYFKKKEEKKKKETQPDTFISKQKFYEEFVDKNMDKLLTKKTKNKLDKHVNFNSKFDLEKKENTKKKNNKKTMKKQ